MVAPLMMEVASDRYWGAQTQRSSLAAGTRAVAVGLAVVEVVVVSAALVAAVLVVATQVADGIN